MERLLLGPVLTSRRFDPACVDPRRTLTEFAVWASQCSPAVLRNAALALKKGRDRKVFAADLEKAVLKAADNAGEPIVSSLPGVEYDHSGVMITRQAKPQQYEAWLRFHTAERTARRPSKVGQMESHGFIIADTEWPPGMSAGGAT